jgi:hypothetical protein
MSDAQFTPGPWEVSMDGFSVFSESAFLIADCECIACHSDYSGTDFATAKHARANAHLIAAAPDLLEALLAVVSVADRATVEFDKARAAIKKATGG